MFRMRRPIMLSAGATCDMCIVVLTLMTHAFSPKTKIPLGGFPLVDFPMNSCSWHPLENTLADTFGKLLSIVCSTLGEFPFTWNMNSTWTTSTWEIQTFGKELMCGHDFPTLGNELLVIITEVHLTAPNGGKIRLVFLFEFFNQRKSPCCASLWPFPTHMDSTLTTVPVNDGASNILLEGLTPLFCQLSTLSFGPLIDVLHYGVRTAYRTQPNKKRLHHVNGI